MEDEYIIEYHFGNKDVLKQTVKSESEDLNAILISNTSEENIKFMDQQDRLYSFKLSNVMYTKIYKYPKKKIKSKPEGL